MIKRVTPSLLLLLLLASPAWAKSYHFTTTHIAAEIRPDGSMHVRESRAYAFRGTFHEAWREVPLPGGVRVENFVVSEGGQAYRETPGGAIGTYYLTPTPGQLRADWYYEATDQTRTFVLDYDVIGAAQRHADYAELYWQFIGTDWDVRSDVTRVTVTLPGTVPRADIRAWAHGVLWGNIKILDGAVESTCDPLPPHEMLAVRLLFPRDAIAQSSRSDDRVVLDSILTQEARLARQANEGRGKTKRLILLNANPRFSAPSSARA